jgi:hypothetical protein
MSYFYIILSIILIIIVILIIIYWKYVILGWKMLGDMLKHPKSKGKSNIKIINDKALIDIVTDEGKGTIMLNPIKLNDSYTIKAVGINTENVDIDHVKDYFNGNTNPLDINIDLYIIREGCDTYIIGCPITPKSFNFKSVGISITQYPEIGETPIYGIVHDSDSIDLQSIIEADSGELLVAFD